MFSLGAPDSKCLMLLLTRYCVVVWVLFSAILYYRTSFSDRIIGNLKKLPNFSFLQVSKILLQVDLFTMSAEHLWVYM